MALVSEFIPHGAEVGVGLAIQHGHEHYIFFLAGTRHHCTDGEMFYAGIGGHVEPGEDFLACAHREAREEVGVDVDIMSSAVTWHVSHRDEIRQIEVDDGVRPLAVYEMIHPEGTPRAGGIYHLVIYNARLRDLPTDLKRDEVQGVLALTIDQVVLSLERKLTLGELLAEGAILLADTGPIPKSVSLYPIGTARALALIWGENMNTAMHARNGVGR